ncbi:MAG: hypothetical protein LUC44_08835 [Prevotellaceae bacterium]|nr:hypothetical protein [Prevotellaceae bacterium]
MEGKNYLKLVWLLGYIAFAAVSCWATAESLYMLLPSWPKVMCWVVTVGFFIVASIGTKMIVDSFNPNIYLEHRGMRLVGGIIIVLMFWLICSMPTNTHTFFYRNVISETVARDISTTQSYLRQIENNTYNKAQAELKVSELRNKVELKLGELEAEIKNEANPGDGPKSQEIRRELASLLNVPKIESLTYKSTTKQQREILCDAYRSKIYALLDNRISNIRNEILSPSPQIVKEAKTAGKNLVELKGFIDDGTVNLYNAKDITTQVCDKLNNGYNIIKLNSIFVNFNSVDDEKKYTDNDPVTRVKSLNSVFDVWCDYIKGEYNGQGFIYWILISILVDVAAFVFFDLAFRKTEE